MKTISPPFKGSWQNPAFLRRDDGLWVSATRWVSGYNREPGEVYIFPLADPSKYELIANKGDCCSQPGACWHANAGVIFSAGWSGHDEVWARVPGAPPRQLTKREGFMAYEPAWYPTGKRFLFESHVIDNEENGRIAIGADDGSAPIFLTDTSRDCRQPNVSPLGLYLVWQEKLGSGDNEKWFLQVSDGKTERRLTHGGDETDATFLPDGRLIYSTGGGLFVTPADAWRPKKVTDTQFYMGASSVADDGTVACECLIGHGDPDENGKPTSLVTLPLVTA